MNAHTPGPWVAVELPTAIAIKSHMGNVANIQRGSMRDQQQANARLIVAAPDLLDALKECIEDSEQAVCEYIEKYGETYRPQRLQAMRDTVAKARAAIAKAEGGAV